MGILSSSSHINTIVASLRFKKMPGGKTRWELFKDATCCFDPIFEVVPHKTSHKTNQVRWALLEK